jgi:hypothetical protein
MEEYLNLLNMHSLLLVAIGTKSTFTLHPAGYIKETQIAFKFRRYSYPSLVFNPNPALLYAVPCLTISYS